MNYLKQIHEKFLKDVYNSSKIDNNPYTIIPTVVFIMSMFMLLYLQFHQCTNYFTRWSVRIYKDVIFHWAFFYICRLWFVFLKFCKYVLELVDDYVKVTSPKKEIAINIVVTHSCVFMLLLTISIVPLMFIAVQELYRSQLPNIFTWVAEDPWVRSEIGTSGHYLERPAHVAIPYNKVKTAYRSKRSSSADNLAEKDSKNFRTCKSLIAVKKKSFDGLVLNT